MERMSEHLSAPIIYLSLLLVQSGKMSSWPVPHLYLDIAKSGYLFHAVGNVMRKNTDFSANIVLIKLMKQF